MVVQELVQCEECFNTNAHELHLLFSCTHVVCKDHLDTNNACPICASTDTSSAPMNKLPPDCEEYFSSIGEKLSKLTGIFNFQQDRMGTLLAKQREEITRLSDQLDDHQRALQSVRRELVQARELQKEVDTLHDQLAKYQDSSSTSSGSSTMLNNQQRPKFGFPVQKAPATVQGPTTPSPFKKANHRGIETTTTTAAALQKFQPSPQMLDKFPQPSPRSNTKPGSVRSAAHPFQQLTRTIRTKSSHQSNIVSSGSITKNRRFLNRVSSPNFQPDT